MPRLVARQLGEAEVEDLHAAVGVDHHVGGLQVAMGDAALVGGADRVGQRESPSCSHASSGSPSVRDQRRASVWPSTSSIVRNSTPSCFLDRVDRDDVGMVERGDGPRLALEALPALGPR